MKKVLRIAILCLCFLAILAPTYILVSRAASTATPDVMVGERVLDAAYVRWRVVRKNDSVSFTAEDLEEAVRRFESSEPMRLSSLEELVLTCDREPVMADIHFFDLSGSGAVYEKTTLADLSALIASGFTLAGKTQVVIAMQWTVGDNIRIQAMYSLEVGA